MGIACECFHIPFCIRRQTSTNTKVSDANPYLSYSLWRKFLIRVDSVLVHHFLFIAQLTLVWMISTMISIWLSMQIKNNFFSSFFLLNLEQHPLIFLLLFRIMYWLSFSNTIPSWHSHRVLPYRLIVIYSSVTSSRSLRFDPGFTPLYIIFLSKIISLSLFN